MTSIKTTFMTALISLALAAPSVWASGSGGYGGGGSYRQPSSSAPVRKVDQTYEYGKALFQGRISGVEKREFCVDVDGEKVALKRSSVKNYKGGSYQELANALYDCNQPEQKIGLDMSSDNFQFVLYYLNKRYRLKLSNLSDV